MMILMLSFATLGALALSVGLAVIGAPLWVAIAAYPLGGATLLIVAATVVFMRDEHGTDDPHDREDRSALA